MDRWIAHVLLVTPAAHRAAAAQLMAQASGNPADAVPEAFSVPVCALDGDMTTHWACHTRVRASTLAALPQLAALIPGSLWHVTSHDDDTPHERAQRPAIEIFLAAHGLALQPPEEET